MKLTALAVAILALGIVVGFALAGGASEGPASAAPKCPGPSSQCATPTPEPPQQREDQVSIWSGVNQAAPAGGYRLLGDGRHIVALDPADYPTAATFRLESIFRVANADGTDRICTRLFDLTAGLVVGGSELCWEVPSGFPPPVRLRSAPVQLSSGEHEYSVQGRCEPIEPLSCDGRATAYTARIIVEWTE